MEVKLLALDTATEYLSLALWLDGEIMVRDCLAGQRHSELTLPWIRELVAQAGIALSGLDAIAFSNGPGSFTSLRIGCGIAQGLAFGIGSPLVGISTLQALAQDSGGDRVIACLDARMNQLYHAAYVREAGCWRTVCEPGLYDPTDVPSVEGAGWTVCGSGVKAFPKALEARYGDQLARRDPGAFPHARATAQLAIAELEHGGGLPADQATLVYLRDKVALKSSERIKP